jgi:hypothetical protein
MCVEKVTSQQLRNDMSPEGFARVLEYDLRVELSSADTIDDADANFVRELRKVNGHTPRRYDLDDRNTCLDPNPLTPEPLTFLLSRNRGEYIFNWVGFGKGKDANTLMFDYQPVKTEKAAFVEDEKGRDNCFQLSLPVERKGRVWVDATTYDVLRIEQRPRHASMCACRGRFSGRRIYRIRSSSTALTWSRATSRWRFRIRKKRCCCPPQSNSSPFFTVRNRIEKRRSFRTTNGS